MLYLHYFLKSIHGWNHTFLNSYINLFIISCFFEINVITNYNNLFHYSMCLLKVYLLKYINTYSFIFKMFKYKQRFKMGKRVKSRSYKLQKQMLADEYYFVLKFSISFLVPNLTNSVWCVSINSAILRSNQWKFDIISKLIILINF